MRPDTSVIIPSYQGERRLPKLLDALASQATRFSYEVVLVLDGSTDNSGEIARDYKSKLDLKIVDRTVNKGRSVTLNEGFESARGEVLIRCDDDLLPATNYIDQFTQRVLDQPDTGVIGLYRNVYPDTAYAVVYGRPVDKRFRVEAYQSPVDAYWRYWAGNCAVHRDMWTSVGPYDGDTFQAYGWEDVDWGYRLTKAGGEIELAQNLETIHRVAATTAAIRAQRAFDSGKAAAAFDAKHNYSSLPDLHGAWGYLVEAARGLSGRGYGRLDSVLKVVPQNTGRRMVDLAIQGEFRRGYLQYQTLDS